MYRKALQAFPLLLVVVVECVGSSLATSADHHTLNHEVLVAITVNQMALLQEMNASSSICASRESELRELQQLRETTLQELEGMKEEAKSELQGIKDEARDELQALARDIIKREVKEAVRNASFVQPSQQLPRQLSQQPNVHALHNDSYLSLCSSHKVLVGSRGSLSPAHPQPYRSNMFCLWQIILPEGTRPVITWEYMDVQTCSNCVCDWLMVWAPGVVQLPMMCGNSTPTTQSMDYIMNNEFRVIFRSDSSHQRRGFVMHYAAELIP